MENSTIDENALKYLEAVKVEFQHDRIKHDVFNQMLIDYHTRKIDIYGIKVRAKGLFKKHTHLIPGFNIFLPKEHHITPKLEWEDGTAFDDAVHDALQGKSEKVVEYLDILDDWKKYGVDIKYIVPRINELLKDHIDLIFAFEAFVPPVEYPTTINYEFEVYYFKKKFMKREVENERSNKPSEKRKIMCEGNTRSSNTSHRAEFQILDTVNSDVDETTSSDKGFKKKIKKREAKNERSSKPSKKRKINNNGNDQLQEERPELPLAFKEKIEQMEGSDVMLVMQKELTMSDVTKNNGRLSIPKNQCITENFLESKEKLCLDYVRGNHTTCNNIDVSVLGPRVTLYDGMVFKKWKMVKSESYNITGKWKNLVGENQLETGQKVQLWSFRSHRRLCFAVVKL